MGAAKRLYDNSYNEHLETTASAMAYLDAQKESDLETKVRRREQRREESGFIINLMSVVGSIIYCVLILGLLLMPLIAETKVHKMKVSFSDIKNEIGYLKSEISDVEDEFNDKIVLSTIEQIAIDKLGLQNPTDIQTTYINSNKYFTIDESDKNIENIDVADN